jgi:HEPN domain-containing protein
MALDRIDLQNLAELRVKDARLLIDNGQYDGGYYLAGYAVECAFKAVIAVRTRQHEFPDVNIAKKVYTHNLKELLEASGLKGTFDQEFARDPDLRENWDTVREWSETSRYEAGRLKDEADDLFQAITDPAHGILSCIRKYW